MGGSFRTQMQGGRKIGGGGKMGKLGDSGTAKLGGREVQSEGNGDLIQEGGGCILVHGRCMGRGGLSITSRGEAYVPDSEDEDDNMEMEDMAMEGEADVMVPATRSATVVRPGRAMVRAADGVPCIEAAADGPPDLELAPEVQARLQEVLAGIDPMYHDVFISMYKVMVPAFFRSNYFFCCTFMCDVVVFLWDEIVLLWEDVLLLFGEEVLV